MALGDSYAAGEGLGGWDTDPVNTDNRSSGSHRNTCHRSASDAYGSIDQSAYTVLPQVAKSHRAFWACSGARSYDMTQLVHKDGKKYVGYSSDGADVVMMKTSPKNTTLAPQDRDRTEKNFDSDDSGYQDEQPWQTDTLTKATRWVSVSAGGNDAGFSDIGTSCAAALFTPDLSLPLATVSGYIPKMSSARKCHDAIETGSSIIGDDYTSVLGSHLTTLYEKILDNSSDGSRLAVTGYPAVLPSDYDLAPVGVDLKRVCVTDNLLFGVHAGLYANDAQEIDHKIIRGLNQTIQSAVAHVNSQSRYAGRVAYADTYSSSTPQNCTGHTPGVTVNGIRFSALKGPDPSLLHKVISSATFHPTKTGQTVMAAAVQKAFSSLRPRTLVYNGRVHIPAPYNGADWSVYPAGGRAPGHWVWYFATNAKQRGIVGINTATRQTRFRAVADYQSDTSCWWQERPVFDRSGNLWLKLCSSKVERITPSGAKKTFSLPKKGGNLVDFAPANDGTMWLATKTRFFHIYSDGDIEAVTVPKNTEADSLVVDTDSSAWSIVGGTRDYLDRLVHISTKDDLTTAKAVKPDVFKLVAARDGTAYVEYFGVNHHGTFPFRLSGGFGRAVKGWSAGTTVAQGDWLWGAWGEFGGIGEHGPQGYNPSTGEILQPARSDEAYGYVTASDDGSILMRGCFQNDGPSWIIYRYQ